MLAEFSRVEFAYIYSVPQDLALGGIIAACQQFDEGGLARAVESDFDHTPLLDHQNTICFAHRREAVRNQQGRKLGETKIKTTARPR